MQLAAVTDEDVMQILLFIAIAYQDVRMSCQIWGATLEMPDLTWWWWWRRRR